MTGSQDGIYEGQAAAEEEHQHPGSQPSNYSNHYFSSILLNNLSPLFS
jgi:hypothetical protein